MRVSDIPLDASMGQSPLLYTLGVETQGEEGGLDLSLEPLSSTLSAAPACFLLSDKMAGYVWSPELASAVVRNILEGRCPAWTQPH